LHDDDVKEDMYRTQFLQAFNLTEWNDEEINKETLALYHVCNKTQGFSVLLEKMKQSDDLKLLISIMGENDDIVVFKCLFKFELFDLAHKYFCNIIEKKPYNNDFTKLLHTIK
tara:strand:- start:12 stop:350 length:339 start_codon:yes stop_codon:yes gene_type:complete